MTQNLINGLAVRGYDLVDIVDNRSVNKGNKTIIHQFENATYRFISKENRRKFMSTPSKYIPQYGGFCSIAMSEGGIVDANPQSFLIQNNKLFLFYSKYFGIINTKNQWLKDANGKEKLADEMWVAFK